ncbi:MAG TPA: hypothetical protein VII92_12580 [Anaerolineae bacterium]
MAYVAIYDKLVFARTIERTRQLPRDGLSTLTSIGRLKARAGQLLRAIELLAFVVHRQTQNLTATSLRTHVKVRDGATVIWSTVSNAGYRLISIANDGVSTGAAV